jgi:hypothetical protein
MLFQGWLPLSVTSQMSADDREIEELFLAK